VVFEWGEEQIKAMAQLKRYLTEAPALISISYEENTGLIILAIDANLKG